MFKNRPKILITFFHQFFHWKMFFKNQKKINIFFFKNIKSISMEVNWNEEKYCFSELFSQYIKYLIKYRTEWTDITNTNRELFVQKLLRRRQSISLSFSNGFRIFIPKVIIILLSMSFLINKIHIQEYSDQDLHQQPPHAYRANLPR